MNKILVFIVMCIVAQQAFCANYKYSEKIKFIDNLVHNPDSAKNIIAESEFFGNNFNLLLSEFDEVVTLERCLKGFSNGFLLVVSQSAWYSNTTTELEGVYGSAKLHLRDTYTIYSFAKNNNGAYNKRISFIFDNDSNNWILSGITIGRWEHLTSTKSNKDSADYYHNKIHLLDTSSAYRLDDLSFDYCETYNIIQKLIHNSNNIDEILAQYAVNDSVLNKIIHSNVYQNLRLIIDSCFVSLQYPFPVDDRDMINSIKQPTKRMFVVLTTYGKSIKYPKNYNVTIQIEKSRDGKWYISEISKGLKVFISFNEDEFIKPSSISK